MSEKGKEYLIPKLDFQNNSSSNKAYIIRHTGYESIVCKEDGVEMLQLADGDFITAEDINMIVQEMTAFADTEGFAITSVEHVQVNPDLMNIVMNGWS